MRTLFDFRQLTPGQLAFDVSLAVFCVVIRLWAIIELGPMILVVCVMGAALAVRRLSPSLALAIAWAGAAFQLLSGLEPDVSNLAILPVLYATAAYGTNRTKWSGLVSAGAGALLATGYMAIVPLFSSFFFDLRIGSPDAIPQYIFYVFFLSGAFLAMFGLSWTLGLLARTRRTARKSRQAQKRAEEEEARARQDIIVEQERNRIARDMHDVVAHSLAVVIAQADGARYARGKQPDAVDSAFETISSTARDALTDVRVLLAQLRRSESKAPQRALADLDRLVEQFRASGLKVVVNRTGEPDDPGLGVELALYRIVQEALTNALRHGDTADPVTVDFDWRSADVELRVSNSVAAGRVDSHAGHGLAGMRERAQLAGGFFEASDDGETFSVVVTLPLSAGGAS